MDLGEFGIVHRGILRGWREELVAVKTLKGTQIRVRMLRMHATLTTRITLDVRMCTDGSNDQQRGTVINVHQVVTGALDKTALCEQRQQLV